MIIGILTILLLITLRLLPKRNREKVLFRLKRILGKARSLIRGSKRHQ